MGSTEVRREQSKAQLPGLAPTILPLSLQPHWASFMSWNMLSCSLSQALAQAVFSIWNALSLSTSLTRNYLSAFTLNVTFPERPFLALAPQAQ